MPRRRQRWLSFMGGTPYDPNGEWTTRHEHQSLKARTTDPEAADFDEAVQLFRKGLKYAREGLLKKAVPLIATALLLDTRSFKFVPAFSRINREEDSYYYVDMELLQQMLKVSVGKNFATKVLSVYSAMLFEDVPDAQERIIRALKISEDLLNTVRADLSLEDMERGILGGCLKRTVLHRLRSQLYLCLEKPEKAIQELSMALQIDPSLANLRCSRACLVAAMNGEDPKTIAQEFRQVVADSHPDARVLKVAYAWLANLILENPKLGTYDQALTYFERSQQAAGRYSELYGQESVNTDIQEEVISRMGGSESNPSFSAEAKLPPVPPKIKSQVPAEIRKLSTISPDYRNHSGLPHFVSDLTSERDFPVASNNKVEVTELPTIDEQLPDMAELRNPASLSNLAPWDFKSNSERHHIDTARNTMDEFQYQRETVTPKQKPKTPVQRECMGCGRSSNGEGGPLLQCSGCRKVCYCSKECQLKDWSNHYSECEKYQDMVTSASEPLRSRSIGFESLEGNSRAVSSFPTFQRNGFRRDVYSDYQDMSPATKRFGGAPAGNDQWDSRPMSPGGRPYVERTIHGEYDDKLYHERRTSARDEIRFSRNQGSPREFRSYEDEFDEDQKGGYINPRSSDQRLQNREGVIDQSPRRELKVNIEHSYDDHYRQPRDPYTSPRQNEEMGNDNRLNGRCFSPSRGPSPLARQPDQYVNDGRRRENYQSPSHGAHEKRYGAVRRPLEGDPVSDNRRYFSPTQGPSPQAAREYDIYEHERHVDDNNIPPRGPIPSGQRFNEPGNNSLQEAHPGSGRGYEQSGREPRYGDEHRDSEYYGQTSGGRFPSYRPSSPSDYRYDGHQYRERQRSPDPAESSRHQSPDPIEQRREEYGSPRRQIFSTDRQRQGYEHRHSHQEDRRFDNPERRSADNDMRQDYEGPRRSLSPGPRISEKGDYYRKEPGFQSASSADRRYESPHRSTNDPFGVRASTRDNYSSRRPDPVGSVSGTRIYDGTEDVGIPQIHTAKVPLSKMEGRELANRRIRNYLIIRYQADCRDITSWWHFMTSEKKTEALNMITHGTIPAQPASLMSTANMLATDDPNYAARVLIHFSLEKMLSECDCTSAKRIGHDYHDELIHQLHYYLLYWELTGEQNDYNFCVSMVEQNVFPNKNQGRPMYLKPPRHDDHVQVHKCVKIKHSAPTEAVISIKKMVNQGKLKEKVPFEYVLVRDSFRLRIYALLFELYDKTQLRVPVVMPIGRLKGCEHCRQNCSEEIAIMCQVCTTTWWCCAGCKKYSSHGARCPVGHQSDSTVLFSSRESFVI